MIEPVSDEVRGSAAGPWLGPFRFKIGFDGFRQLFHAENDRYMRKLGAGGVLCTGWVIPGEIYYLITNLLRHTFVFSWSELWDELCGAVVALGFLWLLVRPPFGFSFRLDEVARFFVAHGANFTGEDVDPRGVAVSVSTSLCELGGEEVAADGTVVRTPFAFMRRRPVWTRDFLFLAVRDTGRDSVLWNISAEGGGLFRKAWDGDGVALPRACVPDRRAVSREVRARVREASGRYKRAVRLAKRAGHSKVKRDEALALVAPELAWLEEADRLNAENRRLREAGVAPPVAQRLVPVPGPGRMGRALRVLWRWVKAAARRLRVLAVRYNRPLPDIVRGNRPVPKRSGDGKNGVRDSHTKERAEMASATQPSKDSDQDAALKSPLSKEGEGTR